MGRFTLSQLDAKPGSKMAEFIDMQRTLLKNIGKRLDKSKI